MMLNELPGAELILPGLEDVHNCKMNTVGALLIAIAATRLITAGLDFPRDRLNSEPELTLYTQLQAEQDDAYLYYNALLNRLSSFCNALELISTPTFAVLTSCFPVPSNNAMTCALLTVGNPSKNSSIESPALR